jgi:23S rRNA (adenine2503-C2)-methyltransferase
MTPSAPRNIRELTIDQIRSFLESNGEQKFRTQQIWDWIWKHHAHSFAEMSNLSKGLREKLGSNFTLPALTIDATQYIADGTIKSRFVTHDGHKVEGVMIPTTERLTACVSSQVGCSLNCKFCATGYIQKERNLHFDEIFDEVVLINRQCETIHQKKLTNIVFMGMGEPMLNYKNVMKAIERITSPEGLGMSARRITVSTAGVAKMIRQLGDDGARVNLALSLHAATDAKRNEIMSINESNNLKSLTDAINHYYKQTGNKITLEYILFDKFNDSQKDADDLIKIYRQVPADLVNIIEYNPIDFARFRKPDEMTTHNFMTYLEKNRVNARLRKSRGKDIDAACGQLANKEIPAL